MEALADMETREGKGIDAYIDEVKKYVGDIKYGTVTLVIQDGKVIQIDKTEKIRIRNKE